MSYDGRLMRQALARFDEDKQRRSAQLDQRRRALYALDASYDRLSADQDCSGASGGDKRVCLSAAHFFHADNDRRIFFVADRIDRRFLRLDDLSRIDNLDLFFLICMLF